MNRKGGELDAKSLDELFQDLGYHVITKKNPTKDEIDELAEEVEFNVQHNMKGEIDLLIVCVMSHGRLGYFSSSDNKEVNVFQFLQSLNDIPLLQDGGGEDGGAVEIGYAEKDNSLASFLNQHSSVVADGTDDGPQPFKDTLVVYSTQPAFYSYRDLYSGTWFTQSLVRVFRRPNTLARKEIRRLFDLVAIEMEEIIKRYNRGGAGDLRQGCEYSVNHFKKELFLNPPPSFNCFN